MCPQDYITSFRRAGSRSLNRSFILEDGKQRLRIRKEIEEPASLVDVGIVPKVLVDIFPSAPEKSTTTKRSTSKGARLITADTEQPSTSTVNKPDASKQTSKRAKPQKENASKKRKHTKRKTSHKSDLNLQNDDDTIEIYLDDGIFEVCMMNTPQNWVGCDECTRLYHYECLPHSVQTDVDLSFVTGLNWKCSRCDEE